MKLRYLLLTGFAGMAISLFAQTHTQGIEYYKADQITNAEELLNRNLNNAGTDKALTYYYLGLIQMDRKNIQKAEGFFNKGLEADPENPYNYIGLGYVALKNGDVKGAEKYFKEAESKGKKDMSVLVDIARSYYNVDPVTYKDKYEKKIETALKKDSSNPDIYVFQGDVERDAAYAQKDSKSYGSAAAKYDMATSYDPTSAVAYVKYADLYMNANNPGYAIMKLEELLKNNPGSALGQRELANAYYEKGDFAKAADQYGKYVKNPNHFKEDEDRYSFLLFYDGKYDEGYNYATNLLNGNPDNFSARRFQFMNAAQIEAMQGSLLEMAENLLAAHRMNPSQNKFAPIDYNLISDVLNEAARTDEAISLLNEAIAELPENPNFHKQLALVYVNAEDYGKAADSFTGYIKKNKDADYNEFVQQALYAYFAGVQNSSDVTDKNTGEVIRAKDAAKADKYFKMATEYANKAIEAYPEQYKPRKILGDVAIFQATESNKATAGKPMYDEAIVLLESSADPRRYDSDAKVIYNYLGNYYLETKDVAKAKEYFNKYLNIDPNNADYRKFVDSLK